MATVSDVTLADAVPRPNPKVVEPDPKDVVLCSYDRSTLDGRWAAWVVRQAARKHEFPVEFCVANDVNDKLLTGRNWIDVTSDPRGVEQYALVARSSVSFARGAPRSPEPLPFKQWPRTFPYGIRTMVSGARAAFVCHQKKSLCMSAWEFFNADRMGFERVPRVISHIDDYTTGANKFKDTLDVVACLESYDTNFQTMDSLAEAMDDRHRRGLALIAGQAIRRYKALQEPAM